MANSFNINDTHVEMLISSRTHGDFVILLDKEDYKEVSKWNWNVTIHDNGKRFYVRGYVNRKMVMLHRFITNAERGRVVDHINHNTLDNRRNNLRVVSQRENTRNRRDAQEDKTVPIQGVCLDRYNNAYKATWNGHSGKSFSINKYGQEEALRLAIEYRLKMEEEHKYLNNDNI